MDFCSLWGSAQKAKANIPPLTIEVRLKHHLQPIASERPPSNRPTENPTGCDPPRKVNAMFLCLPSGKVSETILTAEGRRNEEATPPNPRKMMICALVRERPQARVKAVWNRQPARYIGLLPTASAMEASKRSVQPQVREYTDIGLESREHNERYN